MRSWQKLALWALFASPGSAYAFCPAAPEELDTVLERATAAYLNLDSWAFSDARDQGRVMLRCLDAPLSAAQAAAFHRMEGLNGLLSRDPEKTLDSFRASMAVEPSWEMPTELAPEGHPLREAYEAARASAPSSTVALDVPRCTTLYVDGVSTSARPNDRPVILQLVGEESGLSLWSGYLLPGVEPPGWATLDSVTSLSCDAPVTVVEETSSPLSRALLYSAGATALISGGFATRALVSRSRFLSMEFEDKTGGEELRVRANNAFYAAQAGAALTAGLGGTGLLLRLEW